MGSMENQEEAFEVSFGYHRFTSEVPTHILAERLSEGAVQLGPDNVAIKGIESHTAIARPFISQDGVKRLGIEAHVYLEDRTYGEFEYGGLTLLDRKFQQLSDDSSLSVGLDFDIYPTSDKRIWLAFNPETDHRVYVEFNDQRGSLKVSNQRLTDGVSDTSQPAPALSETSPISATTAFLRVYSFVLEEIAKNHHMLVPPMIKKLGGVPLINMQVVPVEAIKHETPKRSAFDEIGGLTYEKSRLKMLVAAYQNPELISQWGMDVPNTILLYGPAGTGKTSLAEALAKDMSAELMPVDNTEVIDMYVGNSAKAVKAKFQEAKDHDGRVVLLFDEFDGIIPSNDASAAHERQVLKVFKDEIKDIADNYPDVIIVATTNMSAIDPAIIRRFAWQFNVGKPNTQDRNEILTNLVFETSIARGMSEELDNGYTDVTVLPDTAKSKPDIFAADIHIPQLAEETDDLTGADLTEIFKHLRFAKAMEEHETGSFTPITQLAIVSAVQEFKRNRSR